MHLYFPLVSPAGAFTSYLSHGGIIGSPDSGAICPGDLCELHVYIGHQVNIMGWDQMVKLNATQDMNIMSTHLLMLHVHVQMQGISI